MDEIDERIRQRELDLARLHDLVVAQNKRLKDEEVVIPKCGHEDREWCKPGEPCPKCG